MRPITCIALLASLALATDEPKSDAPVPKAKLWAGITVTSPAVDAESVTDARFFGVSFALVNDDDKNFAPTIDVNASKLLVNGKELKEWPQVIMSGPRDRLRSVRRS